MPHGASPWPWTPWAVRPIFRSAGPGLRELVQIKARSASEERPRLGRSGQPQLPLGRCDVALPEEQQAEMEAHAGRARKPPGQRSEPRERPGRPFLRVPAEGIRDERLGLARKRLGRSRVDL